MNDKKDLMENLIKAKEIFDDYLLNKNFIYIFNNKLTNKIDFFEMKCISNNFLHLTGVETKITPSNFYKALDKKRLSLNSINYKSNGTTKLKLEIFNRLPLLLTSPVQVCFQDDFFTLKLQVDILINRPINDIKDIVLGLKRMENFDFFVPASILKEKPQNIGKIFSRVLCIFEKNRLEKKYNKIRYKAKNLEDIELLNLLNKIDINLFDIELLKSNFK